MLPQNAKATTRRMASASTKIAAIVMPAKRAL
jgi:hypothetical protein